MIAQDLTKFMLVTVLLGIILALAIFRPEILPAEASQPTDQPEEIEEALPSPGQSGGEPLSPGDIPPLEEKLEQRNRELDERETGLDQRQYELDQRQVELDEREVGLDQRQAGLDEREAKLEEQTAALRAWEDRLIKQDGLLDEEQAHLREKEASLAEWEQKLEGRQRLSVVAIVVSGLLAAPSVMVLIALMRQGQRSPGGETQRAQSPQTHHRERATQHGKAAVAAPASTYRGNGRDKDGVEYYV